MLISEVVTGNLCQLKGSTNPVKLVLFLQALYSDVTVASLLHVRPITTTFLLHTYETASLIVTLYSVSSILVKMISACRTNCNDNRLRNAITVDFLLC